MNRLMPMPPWSTPRCPRILLAASAVIQCGIVVAARESDFGVQGGLKIGLTRLVADDLTPHRRITRRAGGNQHVVPDHAAEQGRIAALRGRTRIVHALDGAERAIGGFGQRRRFVGGERAHQAAREIQHPRFVVAGEENQDRRERERGLQGFRDAENERPVDGRDRPDIDLVRHRPSAG